MRRTQLLSKRLGDGLLERGHLLLQLFNSALVPLQLSSLPFTQPLQLTHHAILSTVSITFANTFNCLTRKGSAITP